MSKEGEVGLWESSSIRPGFNLRRLEAYQEPIDDVVVMGVSL
ncbi:MAG: hypothetical protein ABEH38_04410 [Flavobacteriales bacterium]